MPTVDVTLRASCAVKVLSSSRHPLSFFSQCRPIVSHTASAASKRSGSNNTVRANVSHDNEDSGIQFYTGGDNGMAALNVTYNNGDHGIDDLNVTVAG